ATYAATGTDWWLSFDYLGFPAGPNTGGVIGWDTDTFYAGNERWLAGAISAGVDVFLTDDGAWHHYVIHLTRGINLTNRPVHIKAEDAVKADAIAGNAYFDNIVLTNFDPAAPPVPAMPPLLTLSLFAALLAVAALHLRQRHLRRRI